MNVKTTRTIIVLSVLGVSSLLFAQQEERPRKEQPRPEMKSGKKDCMDREKGCPEMRSKEEKGGHHDMRMGKGDNRPPKDMHMMALVEHAREAGASDEQIEAINGLTFDHQIDCIDLRAQIEKANLELMRLRMQKEQNIDATMQAVDVINKARGELFKQDILIKMKVRETLGEEVFQKMEKNRPHGKKGPRGKGPSERPTDQRSKKCEGPAK